MGLWVYNWKHSIAYIHSPSWKPARVVVGTESASLVATIEGTPTLSVTRMCSPNVGPRSRDGIHFPYESPVLTCFASGCPREDQGDSELG